MKTTSLVWITAIVLLSLTAQAQPLQPEVLVSFAGTNGSFPMAGLTLGPDGNFYGTTSQGGVGGTLGTVFRVTTNGILTTLASFRGTNGANPQAALTLGDDGSFYGTTRQGGSNNFGTVFKVTTNGTLTALASVYPSGMYPQAALTLGNDGDFYGTTYGGGSNSYGTVFKVTTNGTLTTLASLYPIGANPQAALTLGTDGNFYGTTSGGGLGGYGTVFKVTTDGMLTNLAFLDVSGKNGVNPQAALTLGDDGNFYGTAVHGGNSAGGTVFRAATNGTLTTLVAFNFAFNPVNGANPQANLTLGRDGNFYGTTYGGGSGGNYGTVFLMTPEGTITTLASFMETNGANPQAALTQGKDGYFYGTTRAGGQNHQGTVFRVGSLTPLIISQPQPPSQVVPAGMNVTFNASVLGASPLTNKWLSGLGNVPGATNASLMLTNVSPSMSDYYWLQAENSFGVIFSRIAKLTVLPAIATTLPASSVSATDAVLNASITLGPNETLAWFEWGTATNYGQIAGITNIPGGSSTVTLTDVRSGLDGNSIYHYRVVASNSFGVVFGNDQSFQPGVTEYAQSVATDQPLVYYRFDETNGTIAFNSGFLGAPANGIYNADVSLGNPSLVPAFGFAAGFNNTNSSVAVPALGTCSNLTIEFWARPRTFVVTSPGRPPHSTYNSIYTANNYISGALHTHFIGTFPSQNWQVAINPSNGDIQFGDSRLFPSNSWVHLAATHDSAAHRTIAYLNGHAALTNNSSAAGPVDLTPAHIGNWIGTENWFDGALDEFAIYGKVLPADRIQAHYQAAIGNPVLNSVQTPNGMTLSWAGPGFRLQSNTNVANSAGWTNVPNGNNSPVSVIISNSGNRFFRLHWP